MRGLRLKQQQTPIATINTRTITNKNNTTPKAAISVGDSNVLLVEDGPLGVGVVDRACVVVAGTVEPFITSELLLGMTDNIISDCVGDLDIEFGDSESEDGVLLATLIESLIESLIYCDIDP